MKTSEEIVAEVDIQPVNKPHLYFLDALRGAAAVAVMFYHIGVCQAFAPSMWRDVPALFQQAFILGAHGVEVFFLLSGFVIAYSMCRFTPEGRVAPRPLNLFLIRRWIRLTPPYWAACVLALMTMLVEAKLTQQWPEGLNLKTVAANLFYLQPFLGVTDLFAPAWSLVVEVQFYAVMALLLWICYRAKGSIDALYGMCFISGIVSVLWPWLGIAGNFFFPHWCHFAAGILICLSLNQRKFRGWTAFYLASMLVSAVVLFGEGNTDIRSRSFAMFTACVSGAVIWALPERQRLSSFGTGRVWQWLGRISYSLYLIHMQIGIFLMKAALKVAGERAILGWLAFAVTCVICLAVAHVFHLYLEKPAITWSKNLKSKTLGASHIRVSKAA